MGVALDLSITLGTIIQSLLIAAGGVAGLAILKTNVKTLTRDLAESERDSKERLDAIQTELRELGKVLITMARFDERITSLDQRVTTHGKKLDDLSRGRGFVREDRKTLDGEYKE